MKKRMVLFVAVLVVSLFTTGCIDGLTGNMKDKEDVELLVGELIEEALLLKAEFEEDSVDIRGLVIDPDPVVDLSSLMDYLTNPFIVQYESRSDNYEIKPVSNSMWQGSSMEVTYDFDSGEFSSIMPIPDMSIVLLASFTLHVDMVYEILDLRDDPEYDKLSKEEAVWEVLGDGADPVISVSKNHAEYVTIFEVDSHDEFDKLTIAYHLTLTKISDDWEISKMAITITVDGGYWGVL